jgi:hypothetical protein
MLPHRSIVGLETKYWLICGMIGLETLRALKMLGFLQRGQLGWVREVGVPRHAGLGSAFAISEFAGAVKELT